MAKIFDKIVQSATEPSKNDIWLKDGQLKAFQNGQWESLSPQGQGGQGGGEVSSEHPVRIIELTQETMGTFSMPYEEYINNIIKFKFNISNTGTVLDEIPQNVFFEKIGSSDYNIDGPHYNTGDVYVLNYRCYNNKCQFILYITTSEDGIPVENVRLGSMATYDTYFDEMCLNMDGNDVNLIILQTIDSSKSERALLITRKGNIQGTYYNGTFTAFADGKIQVYDINSETGEVSEKLSIDIETLAGLEARIAALEGA